MTPRDSIRALVVAVGRFNSISAKLLACVVMCLFGGCDFGAELGQTPDQMLFTYQSKVPVGTSLRTARALMEADGFLVTEAQHARWKGKNGFTFLRCVRDEGIVIKRRWEFALMHNGQFVTEVDIRPGLVYP